MTFYACRHCAAANVVCETAYQAASTRFLEQATRAADPRFDLRSVIPQKLFRLPCASAFFVSKKWRFSVVLVTIWIN